MLSYCILRKDCQYYTCLLCIYLFLQGFFVSYYKIKFCKYSKCWFRRSDLLECRFNKTESIESKFNYSNNFMFSFLTLLYPIPLWISSYTASQSYSYNFIIHISYFMEFFYFIAFYQAKINLSHRKLFGMLYSHLCLLSTTSSFLDHIGIFLSS